MARKSTLQERTRADVERDILAIRHRMSELNTEFQNARQNIARNYDNPDVKDVAAATTHEIRLQGATDKLNELNTELEMFILIELQEQYADNLNRLAQVRSQLPGARQAIVTAQQKVAELENQEMHLSADQNRLRRQMETKGMTIEEIRAIAAV